MTDTDLHRLSQLARLAPNSSVAEQTLAAINQFLTQVQPLLEVATEGIAPLLHPSECLQADLQLYLAPDAVTETGQRSANMQNAPAAEKGLFLVPKVIE